MHIPTIERIGSGDQGLAGTSAMPMGGTRLEATPGPLAAHVVLGIFLSVITLGIYRFWYRTSLRRYYWSNTRLAGDSFEYTGTGMELFIGFLIAIAIVIPLYLVVTLVGLFGGSVLGPVVSTLVAAIIMPAIVQILSYRARRYRLLRTRYRGVRFHQTGSGTGYLLRTVKWLILSALTLGIVLPYFRRALERYKIENTWYGTAQGTFSAPVKPLMKIWLAIWGMVVLAIGLASVVPLAAMAGGAANVAVVVVLFLAVLLALPILWQIYRVREFRTFAAGTTIGDVRLSSDLQASAVIWVSISYYLLMIALFAALAGVVWLLASPLLGGMSGSELQMFMMTPSGLFLTYGTLIAFFVIGAVPAELYWRRRLWALRVRSLSAYELASLDKVIQQAGQESLGVGEAFDSGFDIAG